MRTLLTALTYSTTILGYNFSSPFFISPAARADYAHPQAELNLVQGAASGDILYIVSHPLARVAIPFLPSSERISSI